MSWWSWTAAAVEAVLLLVLVLLWYDTLRERRGWTIGRATKASAIAAISVPVGFVIVLFSPFWVGLALVAIPALWIAALALAS